MSSVERRTRHISVPAGRVVGCDHSAEALLDGTVVIRLSHPQQIDPGAENARVGDFVRSEGDPPITSEIIPAIEGGQATAARMVNAIGPVLEGPRGLVAMDQLTLPFVTPRGRPGTSLAGHTA